VLEVDYDKGGHRRAGVVNLHLSWAVGPRGFYYARSISRRLPIGGNIATNSGGPTPQVRGDHQPRPRPRGGPARGESTGSGKTRDAQGYDSSALRGSRAPSDRTKIAVRILRKPRRETSRGVRRMDDASDLRAIIGRGHPRAHGMIDQLTDRGRGDASAAATRATRRRCS